MICFDLKIYEFGRNKNNKHSSVKTVYLLES